MSDKLLTIQQAATRLGVATKTLRRWEGRGVLIPQRTVGNQRRYTHEQIESFSREARSGSARKQTQEETHIASQNIELEGGEISLAHMVAPKHIAAEGILKAHQPVSSPRLSNTNRGNTYTPHILLQAAALLQPTQRYILIGCAVLFLLLGAGSVGVRSGVVQSGLGLVLPSLSNRPQVFGLTEAQRQAVLAETTVKEDLSLVVNIPAIFKKNALFYDLTIGDINISSVSGITTNNLDIDAGTGSITGGTITASRIVAPNLITGLTAGSGISVTTGQSPTITNSGVLSLNGSTGAVTLTAGSGISISGTTITNSKSAQNAFTKMTVGSDTASAGSSTDEFTFAAGTGITLAMDTSNKKLTITGSSGGAGTIGGSGTAGALAKFSAASTLADSLISETGTTVSLGTTTALTASSLASMTTSTSFTLAAAATTLNIGPTGNGASSILLSGGSADTGCTLDGSTGNLTCAGNITGGSTGTAGFWTRVSTTLSPANSGDSISFTGTLNTNTFTSTALTFAGTDPVIAGPTGGSNTISLNSGAGGSVLLAGGSGSTGCTIADVTGDFTCTGSISSSGGSDTGFWSRNSGTSTLSPVTTTDNVSTTGNISATGTGTITSAGLLTGQAGITITGATVNLNAGSTAASNFNTNINSGTSTGTIGIGNSLAGALTVAAGATSTMTITNGALTMSTTGASGGAVNLNSSLAAAGTINSAFNIKTTTDLGATDELVQMGDSGADFFTIYGTGNIVAGGSAPTASATVAMLQLSSTALSGASSSGTYFGVNATTLYAGDFLNFQQNSVNLFEISSVASAINGFKFTAAASGNDPTIISTGTSANLAIQAASGGIVKIGGGSGNIVLDPGTNKLIAKLSSTGDFEIQNGSTAFWTFAHSTTTSTFDFVGNIQNALVVNANSMTSGKALKIAANVMDTGVGIDLTSSSAVISSGKLVNIDHTGTYTTSVSYSGNPVKVTRALTDSTTATTITVTGSVMDISDNCTVSGGAACTHSANVLSLTQSYASATGATLNIANSGTGPGIVLNSSNATGTTTNSGASMTFGSVSTGTGLYVTSASTITGAGELVDLAPSGLTTGAVIRMTASALTSGQGIDFTGPTSVGITDAAVKLTSDIGSAGALISLVPDYSGSAVTGNGILIAGTDSTGNGNTDYGINSTLTLTGNANKTGIGIYSTVTSSSTTSETTLAAIDLATSITGAASGTRNIYGVRTQPASTAVNTGGTDSVYGIFSAPSSTLANGSTENVYGGYFKATGTVAAGTVNAYGLYIANPTLNITGTSAKFGLHIEDLATTGAADTNYAICFDCDGTFSSSTAINGITWGSDANLVTLYRSASDTLKTDDAFVTGSTLDIGSIPNTGSFTAALCWDNSGDSQVQDCVGSASPDYAEIYPSESDVDYGELVMAGPNMVETDFVRTDKQGNSLPAEKVQLGKLVKTAKPYENAVLGITSQNYGDFSSTGHNSVRDSDNPISVALSGRVPVKVNTENGPIQKGDYLTSSSTPGEAMKATHPGPVVGKALQDYDGTGNNKILVFVNVSFADPNSALANISLDANGNLVSTSSVILNASSVIPHTDAGSSDLDSGSSAEMTPEGQNDSTRIATSSATPRNDVPFDIAKDPLFTNLQQTVTDLQQKLDLLQASIVSSASTSALLTSVSSASASLSSYVIPGEDPGSSGFSSGFPITSGMTASGSATLDSLSVTNDTILGGKLSVLGRTVLSDLGVTGNITAGVLSIKGLDDCHPGVATTTIGSPDSIASLQNDTCSGASINTLGGPLKLQSNGFEGIELIAGNVVIDKTGNIVVKGTVTAKEVKTDKLTITDSQTSTNSAVLSASAGTAVIKAGTTSIDVETSALTQNSLIFTTPERATSVGAKATGPQTITISVTTAPTTDLKVSWWIVDRN